VGIVKIYKILSLPHEFPMKKIPRILLILQILVQTMSCTSAKPASAQRVWNGSADTWWYNDLQYEFVITTPEQFAGFAKLVNKGNRFAGKTITLGANIMLNDTADWQNWENKPPKNKWKPVGFIKSVIDLGFGFGHAHWDIIEWNINNYFLGTFDGNGFVVSGVYVRSSQSDDDAYVGLFGIAQSATIKNLGLTASYIKGKHYIGGLVGWSGNSQIINCYSIAHVVGDDSVGGLVGESDSGKIIDSYSVGAVTGGSLYGIGTGGLVGRGNGMISGSYSASNVTGAIKVGGLAGRYGGKIINSYFTGSVTGEKEVGGVAGFLYDSVSSSYSIGKVTGEMNIGGRIVAGENVGGLVGSIAIEDGGRVISSYYDKEMSGQSDTGKGEGKTTTEMKEKSTYEGWDFDKVWEISGEVNGGYPYFTTPQF
jgi:hypothetical protein